MLDLVVTLPTQPPRPTRNDCNSGSIHILDLVVTLPTQPPRPTRNDRNSGSVHSFDLLVPSVMTATVVLFIPLTSWWFCSYPWPPCPISPPPLPLTSLSHQPPPPPPPQLPPRVVMTETVYLFISVTALPHHITPSVVTTTPEVLYIPLTSLSHRPPFPCNDCNSRSIYILDLLAPS